ncbi:MAG: transhydrogenase subunit alpha, partial [Akkermansiaceae bacterium]|nr:transhydrogenase subunit alpha [Akkermansiaceae bacterium]
RFWHNHGFLGLDTQHPWRTVQGGSRQYVEKLSRPFADCIATGSGVAKVTGDRRLIFSDGSSSQPFDRIVISAHGDQALRLLETPTAREQELLGPFHYQDNEAVIHTDESVMPRTRRCWASWNYRVEGVQHSTHYWMNSLQGVSDRTNYFVSINPSALDESKVLRRLQYRHPLFDLAAVAAQERLAELHTDATQTGRYFCGAWQRYGFHEDGIWSADRLCRHLLERDPWS